MVYQIHRVDLKDLKHRVRKACRTITPVIETAVCTRELLKRFEACLQFVGAQFEYLFKLKVLLSLYFSNNWTFKMLGLFCKISFFIIYCHSILKLIYDSNHNEVKIMLQ